MPYDSNALKASVIDAVAKVAARDGDGAMAALEPIFDAGDDALYGCCCALAETVRQLTPYLGDREGFYSFEMVGPLGNVVMPEDVDPDAAGGVWAARFLATYVNDRPATLALFYGTPPDRLADGFMALLGIAGAAVRAKHGGPDAP